MNEYKCIDAPTAKELLSNSNEIILFDIRDAESFGEGHVEGATNLNQSNIYHYLNNTDKDTPILIMCYHGVSSQSVAQYFSDNGFEDVNSIDGGYEGWKEKYHQ